MNRKKSQQSIRSQIATLRRGIFDMESLRDKLLPRDKVNTDMIHFDASIAIGKVLIHNLELEWLDEVTHKDKIEMMGLCATGMYTKEQILGFYGLTEEQGDFLKDA